MQLLCELTNTINEKQTNYILLTEAINEAVRSLKLNKRGGKITPRNAKDFFKANPSLTVAAGALAVSAYSSYKKNKRNTIQLHAKDEYEKRMIRDVVDSLTSSGKFKVQRVRFEHGGKTWVLKRKL